MLEELFGNVKKVAAAQTVAPTPSKSKKHSLSSDHQGSPSPTKKQKQKKIEATEGSSKKNSVKNVAKSSK